jgi:hypothetical protein
MCKNIFYEKKIILSSSIYFYCIVRTNSSLMEFRELHALVRGVTFTSCSYSTGYSYSSIVSHRVGIFLRNEHFKKHMLGTQKGFHVAIHST